MSEISQSGKCRVTALRAHIRLHMALVNAPKAALTHLGFSAENKDDIAPNSKQKPNISWDNLIATNLLPPLSCGHS